MHQHLVAKGLSTTAESLVQEANLNIAEKKSVPFTYISHCRVSIMLSGHVFVSILKMYNSKITFS